MTGHHVCRRAPLLLGIVAVWAGLAADAAGQGSTATDRTALEAIYRATGGDDWTDNTNWLSNAPLEDWYGVEVADGRVTGLRLGGWDESVRKIVGNGLTGSLPPELGALSHLLWLEVGGNSGLTGPIPVELGNLGNLESLVLQENWLTDSIPAALGQLENLEWLGLDRNALTGSIPADLGNLQYLRGLTFGGNTLSGPVPPELGNLIGLEDLYLGNTMLGGPLPASMSGLSALESLSLDESGLCVPDSPAMRAWVATADFSGAFCEGSVSFLRVLTQPGLGRLDNVLAVADLNGDGRDDIVAGDRARGKVATSHVFYAQNDAGTDWEHRELDHLGMSASGCAVADINSDGRLDIVQIGGATKNIKWYENLP
jgi:hypothetical protein